MINFLDFCTEPSILKVILYIKIILQYACIIIPIGLILMIAVDFFKNVIAKDENEMKQNSKITIKRIIYTIAIFFVPTIVDLVVNIVNDSIESLNVDYKSCITNIDNIEYYEFLEAARKEQEENEMLAKIEQAKADEQEQEAIEILYIQPSSGTTDNQNIVANNYVDYNDITKISGLTKTQLRKGLESEKNQFNQQYKAFIPYIDAYIEAEQKYSVNLFWLLPHESIESGWGISAVAKTCNNLGGLKYASNQGSTRCYDAGQTSENDGYYAKFNSATDFILYHAQFLHTTYLNPSGTYYEGVGALDVLIHYWGTYDLELRNYYLDIVKQRAQAIIDGLE